MKTAPPPPAQHVSSVWVNLATVDRLAEAQGLGQFLEDEGFTIQVQNERTLQRMWFLSRPVAGIHVRVPESSFEQALTCVEENPVAAPFLHKAVHCPSCRSVRVHYPQMTRKNILPTIVAQLLVLLRLMQHEYFCEACHHTWTLKKKAGHGSRSLDATRTVN